MAILRDLHERRVFTICRGEIEWQVVEAGEVLATCQTYDLASAAAARIARKAMGDGDQVKIVSQTY